MKSFLLTCFSIVVTIKLVKEAAQNTIFLLSGIISRVWEFFYQHVGVDSFWTFRLGDSISHLRGHDVESAGGFRSAYEDIRVRHNIKSATTSPTAGTLFANGDVLFLQKTIPRIDACYRDCSLSYSRRFFCDCFVIINKNDVS